MKKTIYALSLAAMMSANSFGANEVGRFEWKLWPEANTGVGATTMINFGPGANGMFISQTDEVEYSEIKTWNAMRFSAQAATEHAGTILEEIRSMSGFFEDPTKETMKVSIAWSLEDEPFFTREYIPIGSSFNYDTFNFEWNTDVIPVDMEEPFVIEAGKEFYVIFEYTEHGMNSSPYGAYMDYNMQGLQAGSSYTALEGSAIVNGEERVFTKEFKDNTDWIVGSSLAASLTLSGSNLLTDCVAVDAVSAPVRVIPGEAFDVTATIRNAGGNSVTQVTAICDVNGKSIEKTFTIDNLDYTYSTDITFTGLLSEVDGGVIPITVTVTNVNGNTNSEETDNENSTTTFSITQGFEKNVLIEEHTGTWCGWCVRGIVAMEEMNEMYPDGTFIGVAVHTGDDMEPANAEYILNLMKTEGAPSMYVSREYMSGVTPTLMNSSYENMRAVPAVATININGWFEEDGIHVKSVSEFGINDSYTDYRVGYIVVEDNVGPYPQQNYYSGGGNGEMSGFENEGKVVMVTYNDVVRSYKGCQGIEGSIPLGVKKGESYTHTDILPYTNVSNKDNVWIVAMLINATNGSVINAVKCPSSQLSAISSIEADSNILPEYFNLQGHRITNPERGSIVIKRIGTKTSKIVY